MSYFFSYQVAKVELFLEMEVLLKAIIKEHKKNVTQTISVLNDTFTLLHTISRDVPYKSIHNKST